MVSTTELSYVMLSRTRMTYRVILKRLLLQQEKSTKLLA
jgi:hypothetical protein